MNRLLYLQNDHPLGEIMHEHQVLLLFAWKLKQGLLNNTDSNILRNYIRYFSQSCLHTHFKREEALFFSQYDHSPALQNKLEFGHTLLEEKINAVLQTKENTADVIEELCKKIIYVIRYEEKQLLDFFENYEVSWKNDFLSKPFANSGNQLEDNFLPSFWKNDQLQND